jgi:acyl-CoA thioesterase-1
LLLVLVFFTACSKPQSAASVTAPPAVDTRPIILAFGDSLTAGHGVLPSVSYPSQLQAELDRLGYKYHVVNAGISGDTTGGGLSRIDTELALKPQIVILELGANDGLRGIPIADARHNLEQMIVKCQAAGAAVVLAGMTLPRNYGPDYIHDFEQMFPELAKEYKTALIPFFLADVAGHMDLNQEDGIHPLGPGYTIVVRNLLHTLQPLLKK